MNRHPLRPLGTSPSKLVGGHKFMRSPNLLGELSEGLRGCLPQVRFLDFVRTKS
jgi:hypothetical protein